MIFCHFIRNDLNVTNGTNFFITVLFCIFFKNTIVILTRLQISTVIYRHFRPISVYVKLGFPKEIEVNFLKNFLTQFYDKNCGFKWNFTPCTELNLL